MPWVLEHLSTDPQTKELSRCHINSIEGTIPLLELLQLEQVKEHFPASSCLIVSAEENRSNGELTNVGTRLSLICLMKNQTV